MNPLLSVIIPVYNGVEYLEEALLSVVNQTYQPLEIILIDDGSMDNPKQISDKFPSVKYFHQEHLGVSKARNLGIKHSSADFIAFHDADDICKKDRLEKQMKLFQENSNLEICLSQIQNFKEKNCYIKAELITEELFKPRMGFISSAIIKKSVFNKIGFFNEKFLHAEDMEWLMRAQKQNIISSSIFEVLIDRRLHSKNLSSDIKQGHEFLMQALRNSIRGKEQE